MYEVNQSSIISKPADSYVPLYAGFDAFLYSILEYDVNKPSVPLDRALRNLLSYLQ